MPRHRRNTPHAMITLPTCETRTTGRDLTPPQGMADLYRDYYDRDISTVASDAQALIDWQHDQARELADIDEPLDLPEVPLHAETLTAFVRLLFPSDRITAAGLRVAVKRLVVVAAALQPEIGRQTFEELARALTGAGIECSRASLSDIHCRLSEGTGIVASGRAVSARSAYAVRARDIWRKKKQTTVSHSD